MNLFFLRLTWACLVVGLTSCGALNTTATERAESFAPYKNVKVGEVSLAEHTLFRYALLLSAKGLFVGFSEEFPERIHIEAEENIRFASAAAVDRRGYLLTAAHTLSDGPVYLGIPSTNGEIETFAQARVVWRGTPYRSKVGFDLAILYIPSPIEHVFEWASHVKIGEEVIGGGLDSETEGLLYDGSVVPFGGVVETRTPNKFRGIPYEEVCYAGPAHPGDSGGPLVNRDGELIGINFGGARTIFGWDSYSYAIRPDIEWLRRMIDDDFTALNIQ